MQVDERQPTAEGTVSKALALALQDPTEQPHPYRVEELLVDYRSHLRAAFYLYRRLRFAVSASVLLLGITFFVMVDQLPAFAKAMGADPQQRSISFLLIIAVVFGFPLATGVLFPRSVREALRGNYTEHDHLVSDSIESRVAARMRDTPKP